LAQSANQFLERFGLRFSLARLVTGAQDSHGEGFEIGLDTPLQEIWESNEEEAILSRRRVVAFISVWSMRSLLSTEVRRVREEGRDGGRDGGEKA
jgi:hypothetical protein